jgi:hypothetical protein
VSKFHEGDRVRIVDRDDLLEQFAILDEDTSGVYIIRKPPWPSDPQDYDYTGPEMYYVVAEKENAAEEWDVPEEVLRPADIFAQIDTDLVAVTEAIDSVNHPAHYTRFPVEVIEITEQLDFNRGNAVKYIARAGFKEGVDELEDLSKAAWYINRAIEKLKKEREDG